MKRGKNKSSRGVSANHPIVQKKIDKSLELSKKEGALATIHSSISLNYLSPFALVMNATASQIGILHALTKLLPAIGQLRAPGLMEKYSRKKIVLTGVKTRIFLWIPMLLAGLLFYLGVPHMIWALIFFTSIAYMCFPMIKPARFSWMGSLVDEHKRGSYFSKRNRIMVFAGIITLILGAIILDGFKKLGVILGKEVGITLLGFGFLFVIAIISKIYSRRILKKLYEPKIHIRKKDEFTLRQFIKKLPETPFGRFTLVSSLLSMSLGISSPFWVVYIIRNLGFSYLWYIAIVVAPMIFQLIFFPFLGRFTDRFGNIRLLKISFWFRASIPFLWIASIWVPSPLLLKLYLLIIPSIPSGFSLASNILATNNYVYDAVKKRKQGYAVAYLSFFLEAGLFVGASIGSLLVLFNIPFMETILFIFLISGVLRIIVAICGGKYLQEVRHIKGVHKRALMQEFHPVHGITKEVHHKESSGGKIEHYI
jgi:MFS family permease